MSKSYFKLTLMLVVYFILVNTFTGCKGKGNEGPQSSATTSKTAIVSKTTSSTFTQAKSSNATASASAQRENTMPADSSANNTENNTANNTENNTANNAAESEDDRFASVDTVLGQDDKEEIDLGGKTISISYWAQGSIPRDTADASALNIVLYRRIKAAEQKYNFKADLVLKEGASNINVYLREIVNNTLAGVKFADIIMTSTQFSFPAHINSNIFLPLDDYINYEDPINIANPVMYRGTMWKGKHYGVVWVSQNAAANLQYNEVLLNREGQPDILDLVESHQWTWDTFLNIAKNCTRDTDGDGIIDQWGVLSSTPDYFMENILYSNGIKNGIDVVDGVEVFSFTTPQAFRTLQFAADLILVHKVYKNTTSTEGNNLYRTGKAAMFLYPGNSINKTHLTSGIKSILAPLPMGPDVSYYTNIKTGISMYSIPVTCEQPRELTKIIHQICLLWDENLDPIPEYQEIINILPYGWDWDTANSNRVYSSEREFILSTKNLYPNLDMDYSRGYTGLMEVIRKMVNKISDGVSVSSAVDSIRGEVENIINSFN